MFIHYQRPDKLDLATIDPTAPVSDAAASQTNAARNSPSITASGTAPAIDDTTPMSTTPTTAGTATAPSIPSAQRGTQATPASV